MGTMTSEGSGMHCLSLLSRISATVVGKREEYTEMTAFVVMQRIDCESEVSRAMSILAVGC